MQQWRRDAGRGMGCLGCGTRDCATACRRPCCRVLPLPRVPPHPPLPSHSPLPPQLAAHVAQWDADQHGSAQPVGELHSEQSLLASGTLSQGLQDWLVDASEIEYLVGAACSPGQLKLLPGCVLLPGEQLCLLWPPHCADCRRLAAPALLCSAGPMAGCRSWGGEPGAACVHCVQNYRQGRRLVLNPPKAGQQRMRAMLPGALLPRLAGC